MSNPMLVVNGIEVIYNHVILVLKGVSLQVPEGSIVALLGGNGAGKTTTLRAVSNLLKGERGEVTKGSIQYRGEAIENLSPAELVRRGVVQVMEGRHCFGHLTVEENLLTGAYTRKLSRGELDAALERVYHYFPRLKTRRQCAAVDQERRALGGPDLLVGLGRAARSKGEDDQVQEEPPTQRMNVQDPRIRKKFAQIAANLGGLRRVGRAEVDEQHSSADQEPNLLWSRRDGRTNGPQNGDGRRLDQ